MKLDKRIDYAFQTIETANAGDAFLMAEDLLADAPDDWRTLFLMGLVMLRSENPGAGYSFCKRAAEAKPDDARVWNNLAKACQEMFRYEEARGYLDKALAIKPDMPAALQNMAVTMLNTGRPEEVFALAERAEKIDPKIRQRTRDCMAQAHFSLGQWTAGWADFHETLGNKFRRIKHYPRDAEWGGPLWHDTFAPKTQPVVIYGEQGIGDEIFFMNMASPLAARGLPIHVDCDARLAGLFRRSFPWARVHGTRRVDKPDWTDPDMSYLKAPMGALGRWAGWATDAAWPGTPYLIPCPYRRFQWQALFRKAGRTPVIGLAWTGGAPKTGGTFKSMGIDTLKPLFDAFPTAQFVSLEHKGKGAVVARAAAEHKRHIAHFPWATETADYDDTAAIVASCDVVVSAMTSVAHLASALGVPTWMMLPTSPTPAWRYHKRGPTVPYYKSMRLVRQREAGEWASVIEDVVHELRGYLISRAAA